MFSILPGISASIIFDHILLFSKEKVKKFKFDYFSITLYRTLLLKEINILSPKKWPRPSCPPKKAGCLRNL